LIQRRKVTINEHRISE